MEAVYSLAAVCQRPIGQSEERRNRIAEVVGSSPIRSTGIYGSLAITGLVIVIGIQAAGVILVMPVAAACLPVGEFISIMPTAAALGGTVTTRRRRRPLSNRRRAPCATPSASGWKRTVRCGESP